MLQGKCLLYFKEPKDFLYFVQGKGSVSPRGSIPLAGASITISKPKLSKAEKAVAAAAAAEAAEAGPGIEDCGDGAGVAAQRWATTQRWASTKLQPCRFRINAHFEDGFRQVTLRAESEEDMRDWIEELKQAMLDLDRADDSAFYRRVRRGGRRFSAGAATRGAFRAARLPPRSSNITARTNQLEHDSSS